MAASPPQVYWASHPVRPNETVLVVGHGLGVSALEVGLESSPPNAAPASVPTVNAHDAGAAVVVPSSLPLGAFAISVPPTGGHSSAASTPLVTVNTPDVWWSIGDAGSSAATAGGWLRVLGRSLAFVDGDCVAPPAAPGPSSAAMRRLAELGHELHDVTVLAGGTHHNLAVDGGHGVTQPSSSSSVSAVSITLTNSATGVATVLEPHVVSCWFLEAPVPRTLATGSYTATVSNGLAQAARTAGAPATDDASSTTVTIVAARTWPTTEFKVSHYGGSVSKALAAAGAAGGGIVVADAARYEMGDGETLVVPAQTVLRGATPSTTLAWGANSQLPQAPLLSGPASFGLEGFTVEATSAVHGVVVIPPTSNGAFVRGLNISESATVGPRRGNAVFIDGNNSVIENNVIVHGEADCYQKYGWFDTIAIRMSSADGIVFRNNTVLCRCQGFAAAAVSRVLMDNNTIVSIGTNVSDGNGFNTLAPQEPHNLEFVSFSQNYDVGNPRATKRYETWTLDGGGGAYLGPLKQDASLGTRNVTVATAKRWGGYAFGALAVLDGVGAGQLRRVTAVYNNGTTFELDAPLSVLPNANSTVSVIPRRTHILMAGNTFVNATTVQLFGTAFHTILADNVGVDMTAGLSAWGRSYQGGAQPNVFVQFLRNSLTRSGYLRTFSTCGGDVPPYGGPGYNRGHVHARNRLDATDLSVQGSASDVVLEHNAGLGGATMSVTNLTGSVPPQYVSTRGNEGFAPA